MVAEDTSLLFIAVSKKEKEEVELLLEMGANPNKGASDTLMDYLPVFVDISNYELLELFLKHNADPNSIENDIHIFEHAAHVVGKYRIEKYLEKKGK